MYLTHPLCIDSFHFVVRMSGPRGYVDSSGVRTTHIRATSQGFPPATISWGAWKIHLLSRYAACLAVTMSIDNSGHGAFRDWAYSRPINNKMMMIRRIRPRPPLG